MSQMYPWTSGDKGKTWNPIGGECPHWCDYCYRAEIINTFPGSMTKYSGPPRLHEKALNGNPGPGTVFVCSMTDLFAWDIPNEAVRAVLKHCNKYPENTYLFQGKNPARMPQYALKYPPRSIFGSTIETNRPNELSEAPPVTERALWLAEMPEPRMISIEPILDFDLTQLLALIRTVKPEFVSIGADSKDHRLDEPPAWKVRKLLGKARHICQVRPKDNLRRLLEAKA